MPESSNSACQGRPAKFTRCDRKPSVVRDSKHFCWQHDPDRLTKLARAAREKSMEKMAAREAENDARIKRHKLVEAAQAGDLTDDELERIGALGGVRRMLHLLENPQLSTIPVASCLAPGLEARL
jgi:hypothetical protein